jgi:hypothetical protein
MSPTLSLPAQLFLLALDPHRRRLTARNEVGPMLRAAALVDLQLTGHLTDDDGRPAARDARPVADPVLESVRQQVATGPRRRWKHWVRRDARRIIWAVRDQLVDARLIQTESYRFLGIIPAQRIWVADPLVVPRITAAIDTTLAAGRPVDDRDAALVALTAAAQLKRVLPWTRRRAERERIDQLTARTGPVPGALRAVLRDQRAAASSG